MNRQKNAWLFGLAACALAVCLSSPLQAKASGDRNEAQTSEKTADLLQAGIVASGVDNGCYWELDSNGNMNITSAAPGSNLRNNGWRSYRSQIKTLNVDVPFSSNLAWLFSDMPYLESAKIKIDQCSGSASCMFYNSEEYSNLKYLDLSGLNTYGITDMSYMFYHCESLESLNLGNFNTSSVRDMSSMFNGCKRLKALNIGSFDTRNVYSFGHMFCECERLEKIDLSGFTTSRLGYIDNMFRGCTWLKSVNLSGWDTTHVVDMSRMFSYCKNLTEIYFNGWSTPNLQYTYSAFADCHSLKKLDLSGLYTGNVTDMSSMFSDCYSLESLLINKWNTSHAIEMDYMFYDCYALKSLNVSSFNTSKVTTMSHMFSHCETLKSLNLGSFNTSNVIDMTSMFAGCYNIKSLDLRSFSTGRTKYMDYMFESCHSLEDVNLRSFRTPSLQRVDGMFGYCYVLKTVDLSKFDFGNVSYSSYYSSLKGRLFYECEDLMIVQAPLHLRESYKVEGDNWYRDDKNTLITEIPMKLNTSVVLHKQEEKNKFVDVRLDGWQYKSVKQIVDLKYMSGKGTTKDDNALIVFDANTPMTRAEFVQVLYNHAGRPSPKKKANFKDVDAKQWYANAVYWAYENKVVSGKGNNLFGVNDKITRQDMVTILYNYAGKINKKSISDASKYNLNEFTDKKDVATYAKLPLQWATGHKIMNGKITQKTKLKLSPKGNATRAEGATVICNFVTYLSKLK